MKFRRKDGPRIAASIEELEARTQAEVVFVARRQSGSYRDVEYLFGGGASLGILCFLLYSPWEFHPYSFPLPLVLAFFVGARACGRWGLAPLFTRRERREQQIRDAAWLAFRDRRVEQTRKRTGILVYFSALEHAAKILPDVGAQALLPEERSREFQGLLEDVCRSREPGERMAEFFRTFGVYLGRVLPAEDEVNELENHPHLEAEEEG